MSGAHDTDLREAISMIRSGRPTQAIPILDRIIEGDETCSIALAERGRARMNCGDIVGAVADLTEMVRRWPDNPKGLTLRAQAHEQAGDWQRAIDDYSAAIAIDAEHEFAYLQRGRMRVLAGDAQRAIGDFSEAMKHDRDGRLSGLQNRGKAKHLVGDLAGAMVDLTEAVQLEMAPIIGPLLRGRVRFDAGDLPGAIIDFTTALEEFPGLTNALRLRAEAKELVGDPVGAKDDRRRYEELGGQDLPAYS